MLGSMERDALKERGRKFCLDLRWLAIHLMIFLALYNSLGITWAFVGIGMIWLLRVAVSVYLESRERAMLEEVEKADLFWDLEHRGVICECSLAVNERTSENLKFRHFTVFQSDRLPEVLCKEYEEFGGLKLKNLSKYAAAYRFCKAWDRLATNLEKAGVKLPR